MKKIYLTPKTNICVNFSTRVSMLAGSMGDDSTKLGDGDNTLGSVGPTTPGYDNRKDETISGGTGDALSKNRFYTGF